MKKCGTLLGIKFIVEKGSAPMRVSHVSFNPEFYFTSQYYLRFLVEGSDKPVIVNLKNYKTFKRFTAKRIEKITQLVTELYEETQGVEMCYLTDRTYKLVDSVFDGQCDFGIEYYEPSENVIERIKSLLNQVS